MLMEMFNMQKKGDVSCQQNSVYMYKKNRKTQFSRMIQALQILRNYVAKYWGVSFSKQQGAVCYI